MRELAAFGGALLFTGALYVLGHFINGGHSDSPGWNVVAGLAFMTLYGDMRK